MVIVKREKKNYEMPSLTVVAFRTERGYAVSGGENSGSSKGLFDNDSENQQQSYF